MRKQSQLVFSVLSGLALSSALSTSALAQQTVHFADQVELQQQSNLEQSKAELNQTISTKDQQMAALQSDVERLAAELANSTETAGGFDPEDEALVQAEQKLEAMSAAQSTLQSDYIAARQEAIAAREDLTKMAEQLDFLNERIAELESEKENLQMALSKNTDSMSEVSLDGSDDINTLRAEQESLKQENQRLAERLALAKKAGNILVQRYNAEQEKRALLEDQLRMAESGTARVVSLQAEPRQEREQERERINENLSYQQDAALNEAQRIERRMMQNYSSTDASDQLYAPAFDTVEAVEAAGPEAEEETISGFVRNDRRKELRQREDAIAAEEAVKAEMKAMKQAAEAREKQVEAMNSDFAEMPAAASFMPEPSMLSNLLVRSGLNLSAPLEVVDDVATSEFAAYQWSIGDVYGSAEQQPLLDMYQFDEKVREYLMRTEARCAGEFAVVPSDTVDIGNVRVDSYDIACVGNGLDATASLMFFNNGGLFSAVAHEANTEMMDTAMDVRDRLVASVKSGA